MEEYRSKSYGDGRMELESDYSRDGSKSTFAASNNGVNFQELRCYSASYATSTAGVGQMPKELKKGKSTNSSSSKAAWCFADPELQRKKRVASYKAYSVEGKVKRSFSKSFRWLKDRYTHMVHGW